MAVTLREIIKQVQHLEMKLVAGETGLDHEVSWTHMVDSDTLACAAGVAAMKYYKEHDIEGHVAEMHEIVAPFMDEMVKKHKCIGEARCIGLFGALEVVKNKETREPMQEYGVPGPVMPWIFAELKKRGFATFGRENFIEICPPLIITKEELEEYLPILDEVLTMVDEKFCD